MRYFPAFLDLHGRDALVVGGGEIAVRKVRLLLKSGARVSVVGPKGCPEIEGLAERGLIDRVHRGFVSGDVTGRAVVHGATGIADVDERVSEAAQTAGVPVNVVDRPELSTFITPAIVDRDPLVIGISSGGSAPVFARRLRELIESLLPARLGRLMRFAESFRGAVAASIAGASTRRRFWEAFFDGPIAETVLDGDETGARERMLSLVNGGRQRAVAGGMVHIVGAGPGDPDLLTLRALRLLQQADVVIYDNLVDAAIVDLARRDAERIYAGKAKGRHSMGQAEINALMAHHARGGKRVVRLKGGDPFVFGRGGEEQAYLRNRGVSVTVVPGITAAAGCAAVSGIPLTHRGDAQAVTLLTGHATNGEPALDWASLARLDHTLAIYMGVSAAGLIARRLIEHGLDPETPAAIIENGTRPNQKVVTGIASDLEAMVRDAGVTGPAMIIVGEVVRHAAPTALAPAATRPAISPYLQLAEAV